MSFITSKFHALNPNSREIGPRLPGGGASGRKFILNPSSCPCTPSSSRFRCFTYLYNRDGPITPFWWSADPSRSAIFENWSDRISRYIGRWISADQPIRSTDHAKKSRKVHKKMKKVYKKNWLKNNFHVYFFAIHRAMVTAKHRVRCLFPT